MVPYLWLFFFTLWQVDCACSVIFSWKGLGCHFLQSFCLRSNVWLLVGGAVLGSIMIARGNFPLSLFTLYPPSTYYVSYADKFSFLIHRQQMWLEGNLIYLEYSRNGRKLLHSNICKCIHHSHPDIPTLKDDGFVISLWSVWNCFLMAYINSHLFMLLHGV